MFNMKYFFTVWTIIGSVGSATYNIKGISIITFIMLLSTARKLPPTELTFNLISY